MQSADPEALSKAGNAQDSRSSRRLARGSNEPAEAKAGSQPGPKTGKTGPSGEADVDCTAGAKPSTSKVQMQHQQGAAGPVADKGSRTIEELAVRFSQATKELQVCQA